MSDTFTTITYAQALHILESIETFKGDNPNATTGELMAVYEAAKEYALNNDLS